MYKIEVAVPVALARNFTYLSSTLIQKGVRVRVPFGSTKLIGMSLGEAPEKDLSGINLKQVDEILDEVPVLSPTLLKLGFWISQYYLHPLGEVFKAMLPTSQTKTTRESYALLEKREEHSTFLEYLFKKKTRVLASTFKKRHAEWILTNPADAKLLKKLQKEGVIQRSKESKRGAKKTVRTEEEVANTSHEISLPALSTEQEVVFRSITDSISKPTTFLLHGVTGSGKTRVYLSVMKHFFEHFGEQAQALVLVPEIALTPQMTRIFEEAFPGNVAVVHSVLSNAQRWSELSKIREGRARILIGPRSAVFASFRELRLLVVDEEHDQSYKQSSGLSYNGRDIAVVRARMEGATCLLGSATPSIESYWNATQGKYKLLELKNRVVDLGLPAITIIPANRKVQKEVIGSTTDDSDFLTPTALNALEENFKNGQQAIVLVNRRGYAYYLLNHETKAAIECTECSISLTVHRNRSTLICHYCGYRTSISDLLTLHPKTLFSAVGVGSQKAETILKRQLPDAKIARLDSDILTSREKLFPLLSAFRNGELDILVGTQILAKGHDFPNVGLTLICELDQMLDLPDFRAGERSFQLIVQAAGRAGRSSRGGKVLIQSLRENDPVLKHAIQHDYASFVAQELALRKSYGQPPFAHLIRIEISSTKSDKLDEFCSEISQWQQNHFEKKSALVKEARIIGPVTPPVEKIKSRFRRTLLFSSLNLEIVHRLAYDFLASFPVRKGDIRIQVDVDPQSLM